MELKQAIYGRCSIRKYKSTEIRDEDIREIVEYAVEAPSASNKQMWHFVAVKNKEKLKAMADAVSKKIDELGEKTSAPGEKLKGIKAYSTFFAKAPVTIAVLCKTYESGTDELLKKAGYTKEERDRLRARPDIQSIGAAIQNLLLAAYEKGYGTCWMTAPVIAAEEIEEILGVSADKRLVALVPIGLPDEKPRKPSRKPVDLVLDILK